MFPLGTYGPMKEESKLARAARLCNSSVSRFVSVEPRKKRNENFPVLASAVPKGYNLSTCGKGCLDYSPYLAAARQGHARVHFMSAFGRVNKADISDENRDNLSQWPKTLRQPTHLMPNPPATCADEMKTCDIDANPGITEPQYRDASRKHRLKLDDGELRRKFALHQKYQSTGCVSHAERAIRCVCVRVGRIAFNSARSWGEPSSLAA